jgi:hypothetical protein
MKKTLIYAAVLSLAIVTSIPADRTSAKVDDSKITNLENGLQLPNINRWRLVKHTFQLHIPRNITALSQLIIDAPSTVAIGNDIDVLDRNGQKININVFVDSGRIIIDFPKKVITNTKLLVELNKVKQPIYGPDSVYRISAKVVNRNIEIPVGIARFHTF